MTSVQQEVLSPSSTAPPKLFSMYYELYDKQREAADFALQVRTAALLCETGSGKTWITGGVLERLLPVRGGMRALIIVPQVNKETTWFHILGHMTLTLCRTIEELRASTDGVLILHYEQVPKLIQRLRKIKWTIIVYDEAHRLRARGGLWSRTARKLRGSANRKLILTGTPIDTTPLELWAQFRFLNPQVLGDNWGDFFKEYLEPCGFMGYDVRLRKDRITSFHEAIAPWCFSLTKDEFLDLDEPVYVTVPVTLRGSQADAYRDISLEGVTRIDGNRIKCELAITAVTKLEQIAGGWVYDDSGQINYAGRSKIRAIIRLAGEVDKPAVIWCKYSAELREVVEVLKDYKVATLTGKTKKKLRPQIQRNFQDGKYDFLICQFGVGGEGIDLFRAHTGIVYSPPRSYIKFEQAIGRLHRRGQTHQVTIFLLSAKETIDEVAYESILSKRTATKALLTHLKRKAPWLARARTRTTRRRPRRSTA